MESNHIPLNNQLLDEEIKKENKKCPETKENKNRIHQNLLFTAKRVLTGMFIAVNYTKNINSLLIQHN